MARADADTNMFAGGDGLDNLLDDELLNGLGLLPLEGGDDTAKPFADVDLGSLQGVDFSTFDLLASPTTIPTVTATTPAFLPSVKAEPACPTTYGAATQPVLVGPTTTVDEDVRNPPTVLGAATNGKGMKPVLVNPFVGAPAPAPHQVTAPVVPQPAVLPLTPSMLIGTPMPAATLGAGVDMKPMVPLPSAASTKPRAKRRPRKKPAKRTSTAAGLDPAKLQAMDPDQLKEYLKKEERKKKNRIAAEKSRRKRKEVERREAAELAYLRVRSKEQQSEIAALTAENRTLKAQLEFFKLWVTRQGPSPLSATTEGATTATVTNPHPSGGSTGAASPILSAGAGSGSDSSSVDGRSCDSINSSGSRPEPSSPRSDSSMSGPRRVRFRARKRHGKLGKHGKPKVADSSDRVCAAAAAAAVAAVDTAMPPAQQGQQQQQGGLRAAAIAGAAFAIVFTFVLSANLDGIAGQHMAMAGLSSNGAGAMFQQPGATGIELPVRPAGQAGRVLQGLNNAAAARRGFAGLSGNGFSHLAAHGHTLQGSMGWAHAGAMAGIDAAASSAAFMESEAPPVPRLWSPSAAVTFVLYALGIKRFAEVVLVNALLLGVGIGLWTVMQRIRGKDGVGGSGGSGGGDIATPAGDSPRSQKRRRRTRSMVRAATKVAKAAVAAKLGRVPGDVEMTLPQYATDTASTLPTRPMKRSRRDVTASA